MIHEHERGYGYQLKCDRCGTTSVSISKSCENPIGILRNPRSGWTHNGEVDQCGDCNRYIAETEEAAKLLESLLPDLRDFCMSSERREQFVDTMIGYKTEAEVKSLYESEKKKMAPKNFSQILLLGNIITAALDHGSSKTLLERVKELSGLKRREDELDRLLEQTSMLGIGKYLSPPTKPVDKTAPIPAPAKAPTPKRRGRKKT